MSNMLAAAPSTNLLVVSTAGHAGECACMKTHATWSCCLPDMTRALRAHTASSSRQQTHTYIYAYAHVVCQCTCDVHVAVSAVVQEEAALRAAELPILTDRHSPQQGVARHPAAAAAAGKVSYPHGLKHRAVYDAHLCPAHTLSSAYSVWR